MSGRREDPITRSVCATLGAGGSLLAGRGKPGVKLGSAACQAAHFPKSNRSVADSRSLSSAEIRALPCVLTRLSGPCLCSCWVPARPDSSTPPRPGPALSGAKPARARSAPLPSWSTLLSQGVGLWGCGGAGTPRLAVSQRSDLGLPGTFQPALGGISTA